MFTTRNFTQLAATAAMLIPTFISSPTLLAGANLIKNGDFVQVGLSGNPLTVNQPGKQEVESAARYWIQGKLVDGSTVTTQIEPMPNSPMNKFHITTDAGPIPGGGAGNGVYQVFAPVNCATLSYWYKIGWGEFTGDLVYQAGDFVSHPKFQASDGAWRQYIHFVSGATPMSELAFESLDPPAHNKPIEYWLWDVQVQPCTAGAVPVWKDLSQYLLVDPFYYQKNPGAPVVKIRVINQSNVTLQGPFHLMLEGMPAQRSLINPDGTFQTTQFVTLNAATLAPGQAEDVTLTFDADPQGRVPDFRPVVKSGLLR